MSDINEKLRRLPKIDKLTADNNFKGLNSEFLKISARNVIDSLRHNLINKDAEIPETEEIIQAVKEEYLKIKRGTLYKVINATGVPIHTNLGRSPIDESTLKEAAELTSGYSNLEYNVQTGKRGDRYHHTADYLRILTGSEDAVIVNNNASAVFLILNTFCKNKEVIVSRGELVEIGGSFRIPDVMSRSGAKLSEIGTTNKTRKSDYEEAVSPKTAMMMKVHKSNYEIVGFSEEASLDDIAKSASEAGVLSYYDAGSGLFEKVLPDSVCDDLTIPDIAKKGFDLISFSGDKMLGGCQAGIIVGRTELIKKIKKNPLMRMLRVDKLTLSILQSVFRRYIEGEAETPVNKMLSADIQQLRTKALNLSEMLSCKTEVISIKSTIGGGSCPLSEIESFGVAIISKKKPQYIEKTLRRADTPVIARIIDDKAVLDVRTIPEPDFDLVKKAAEGL